MTGQLSHELYFFMVFCWLFFLAHDCLMTVQCVAQLSMSWNSKISLHGPKWNSSDTFENINMQNLFWEEKGLYIYFPKAVLSVQKSMLICIGDLGKVKWEYSDTYGLKPPMLHSGLCIQCQNLITIRDGL